VEKNLNRYASMTKWFSPHLLMLAAYRSFVARVFGEFADQRGIQHVADPIPADPELRSKFAQRYDYSDKSAEGSPFWVDFTADVGDGFDSTYAIAYMIAAEKLYGEQSKPVGGIRGIRGLPGDVELPHGKVLVFCGDEVYPWPTHEAYESKTFTPYAMALPRTLGASAASPLPPATRHVYAIPGNHDWYDGLNAFDDRFCRARAARSAQEGGVRFGDWQTRQHRSSFAIKLPHNWWIWGADVQLNDLLDSGQLDYFRTIADHMQPGDRFILLTAEPTWYYLNTEQERFARENLTSLIEAPISRGAKLCGIFSGDHHHYSRYNEKETLGNMNLITAGCGGAYVHGTYHLRRQLKFNWLGRDLDFRLDRKLEPAKSAADPEPKQTSKDACYPSKATSYRLALGNWLFPKRNFQFCLAAGIIYWLMTWTFASLRVDFWVDVPRHMEIEQGLVQTPRALRECLQKSSPAPEGSPRSLQQEPPRARHGNRAPTTDVKACLLEPGVERPDGYRRFTGTGRIDEWTLQLMDFYLAERSWTTSVQQFLTSTGLLFLKGVHLLLLGLINSPAATAFLFAIWAAFFAIAESKRTRKRGLFNRAVQASCHLGVHLLFMWLLYCIFVSFNDKVVLPALSQWAELAWLPGSDPGPPATLLLAPVTFWAGAVYPVEMVLVGGVVGGLIFGLYLMLTYIFAKINYDWLFSSQRNGNYKCFLRMRFEPDKLTIYPIRLDKVPSREGWRWRKNPRPRESLVEPVSALRPSLVEGPIVIRPEEIRNIPRS